MSENKKENNKNEPKFKMNSYWIYGASNTTINWISVF